MFDLSGTNSKKNLMSLPHKIQQDILFSQHTSYDNNFVEVLFFTTGLNLIYNRCRSFCLSQREDKSIGTG